MPKDLDHILRWAAIGAHTLATVALLIVALMFWRWSSGYIAYVGGLPVPAVTWLKAFIAAPDAMQRLVAYAWAWAYGVFSVGALVLALAGIRHVVLSSRALLAERIG